MIILFAYKVLGIGNKIRLWLKKRILTLLIGGTILAAPLAPLVDNANGTENTYAKMPLLPAVQQQYETKSWNAVHTPIEADVVLKEFLFLPDQLISVAPTKTRSDFRTKWINYLTEDGWEPINPSFRQTATGFLMDEAPFIAIAPLQSGGIASFENNNRFDLPTKIEITEPTLTQTIQALGVTDVAGVMETGDLGWGDTQYVIYKQAYPSYDADLIYWVHQGETPNLKKLIRFNSLGKAPPVDTQFDFRISYDKPVYIERDVIGKRVGWTRAVPIIDYIGDISVKLTGSRFVNDATKKRGIGIQKTQIWDSTPDTVDTVQKVQDISINITPVVGDEFVLSKNIPALFFKGAVFPVYTDTVTTVFPDAGTGNTTVDGFAVRELIINTSETFGTLRAGAGTVAADTSTTHNFYNVSTAVSGASTDEYQTISRLIATFDTSGIPDGDTITAGTLSLYVTSKFNGFLGEDSDNSRIVVVASTPANSNAVVAADYGQTGSTSFGESQVQASISLDTYEVITLNASGLSNVSKTGISEFGTISKWDLGNTVTGITWKDNDQQKIRGSLADTSGTTEDPKLIITHAAPGTRIWYAVPVGMQYFFDERIELEV